MRLITFAFLLAITVSPITALAADPTSIHITPPAPKFTVEERHAELAKRRAAVAADLSGLSTFPLPALAGRGWRPTSPRDRGER